MSKSRHELFHLPNFLADALSKISQNEVNKITLRTNYVEHMFVQMFGREAMEILDYVECFPNGAGKGKKMAAECAATGLEGFPTWIINGKVFPQLPCVREISEPIFYH